MLNVLLYLHIVQLQSVINQLFYRETNQTASWRGSEIVRAVGRNAFNSLVFYSIELLNSITCIRHSLSTEKRCLTWVDFHNELQREPNELKSILQE